MNNTKLMKQSNTATFQEQFVRALEDDYIRTHCPELMPMKETTLEEMSEEEIIKK
ncbi:MAG: hypothetical protein O7D95_06200 [Betaproteobacteria bacterium]|nr:hypothetical protein [Betaproteobacteria bacterium]